MASGVVAAVLLAGVVSAGPNPAESRAAAPVALPAKTDVLDVHKLPLGDGRVSDAPLRGSVMSCRMQFRQGGAAHAGPWIHGDTWDLTQKITVRGRVTWPQAEFAITTQDTGRVVSRVVTGNGLPVDTPTGQFPIARNDPAFQIDRNPNHVLPQNIALRLPRDPVEAASPACVPMGMIGVALNGVAIFNALDDAGRDAVAHEVQDLCNGHPQMRGEYHYHGPSPCLPGETENETLIGYAIDGFGIYSIYDASGRESTDADLDACHGRVSEVEWDGTRVSLYHYVLTREYPYTVGCFRGTPAGLPGGRGRG
jgi:YHYH protein